MCLPTLLDEGPSNMRTVTMSLQDDFCQENIPTSLFSHLGWSLSFLALLVCNRVWHPETRTVMQVWSGHRGNRITLNHSEAWKKNPKEKAPRNDKLPKWTQGKWENLNGPIPEDIRVCLPGKHLFSGFSPVTTEQSLTFSLFLSAVFSLFSSCLLLLLGSSNQDPKRINLLFYFLK